MPYLFKTIICETKSVICETKTGVVRILIIFQDRPVFSHLILKVSARDFH